MNKGFIIQTFFTQNPHKRLNYSFLYSGSNFEKNFQKESSIGSIYLFTISYKIPEERYKIWIHLLNQDINTQENKEIQNIEYFSKKNIPINFLENESKFRITRYYLKHSWDILSFKKRNNYSYNFITLNHNFFFETKNYFYQKKKEKEISILDKNINELDQYKFVHKHNSNNLTFSFKEKDWNLESGFSYDQLTYYPLLNDNFFFSKIKNNIFSFITNLKYYYNFKWFFKINSKYSLNGKFKDDFLFDASVKIPISNNIKSKFQILLNNVHPDFNIMFYRNFYEKNDYNFSNFKSINNRSFNISLFSKKYLNFYFNIHNINNYTYFDHNTYPKQYPNQLKIFNLRTKFITKFKKFTLENNLEHQHIISGNEVLSLPNFISRSSLFYENNFFQKSLLLQTGFTLNYFSKFRSREFSPILNEFILPSSINPQYIGGYPFLDYFLNFKIFHTEFYIIAEHINSFIGNHNCFFAPFYPYENFILRFGILWNIFT